MPIAIPAMDPGESLWPGEDGKADAGDVDAVDVNVEDVDVGDLDVEDLDVEDLDDEYVGVEDMIIENDGLKRDNNEGCGVGVVASVSAPVVSGSEIPYEAGPGATEVGTSWEPYGEGYGYTEYDMLGMLRSHQGRVV